MLGYDAIPSGWKAGLDRVEDMDFKYTTLSLNEVYEMSNRHALEMIGRNGGNADQDQLVIPLQEPVPVRYERGFEGHFPVSSFPVPWESRSLSPEGSLEYLFTFEGTGFVMQGGARKAGDQMEHRELNLEVFVDGNQIEEAVLPTSFQSRRHEVTWKYKLQDGEHEVRLVWINPLEGYRIDLNRVIVYGPEPSL
jgi:hypothetical protein